MKNLLVLLALLLTAGQARAVTFDNSVGGQGQSFNYTVGSGSNAALVLNVFSTGAGSAVAVAYYGGQTMTAKEQESADPNGRVEQWTLLAPSAGSHLVTFTFTSVTPPVVTASVASYFGVQSIGAVNGNSVAVSGGTMKLSGTATAGNWSVFMVGALTGGSKPSPFGSGGFVYRRFSQTVGSTYTLGDEPADASGERFGCGCTDTLTGAAVELVNFVATATPTFTASPTPTPTATITSTFTSSPTFSASPTFTITATRTPSPTPTATRTPSPTPTASFSASPTLVQSQTMTFTNTPVVSATPTATATVTPGLEKVPENSMYFKNVNSQTDTTVWDLRLTDPNGTPSNGVGYYSPPLLATVNVLGSGSWTALSPTSNCHIQPCNAVLSVPASAATTWSFQAGNPAATPVVSNGEAQSVPGTPFSVNIPMLPGQTIWTNSGASTGVSAAASTFGQ